MGERLSEYVRDDNDWYVEPIWCVEILRALVPFSGSVHDPCCGMGTIPMAFGGTGSDRIDRGYGYRQQDFLNDTRRYDNIVTNPPYATAQKVIEHGLSLMRDRVAALVQVKFLASQGRYPLFSDMPTEKVIMLSKRPSMPPGGCCKGMGWSYAAGAPSTSAG